MTAVTDRKNGWVAAFYLFVGIGLIVAAGWLVGTAFGRLNSDDCISTRSVDANGTVTQVETCR